jgi:DNA-binding MarR family transcriptional regulator
MKGDKNMCEKKCDDKKYVGKFISQLYRKSRVFINREVAKYDLSSGQLMYLMDLYVKDGKNQEEISEVLKIDKGTTARAIKKLEKQNLITRVKDSEDKRSNKVFLTQKAKDIKPNIYSVFNDWNKIISESLTEEEEVMLKSLLEKVCKHIDI